MQLPHYQIMLLSLILGLAVPSVTAIDAYYHLGTNCDGASIVCSNLNPGVCCSDGHTKSNTIGYRGIPLDWVIAAKAWGSNSCGTNSPNAREVSGNTNFLCLKARFGEPLGATRYDFGANSKRRDDFGPSEAKSDEECQKPDQLVLGDGVTKFDIAGLEDDVVDHLLKLATEGSAIPAEFHSHKL